MTADAFDALDRRIDYLSDRVVVITGQPGTIRRNPQTDREPGDSVPKLTAMAGDIALRS